MTSLLLAPAFRFRVSFNPSPGTGGALLGVGGFAEVTGLDAEMDVTDYAQGGRNDAVVQRAGRIKVTRLVLRRGMVHPADGSVVPHFWNWLSDTVSGVRPIRRYDVQVCVLDRAGAAVATWTARRALPARISGPALNARTGEVAVEECQLAHEGLSLEAP